MISDTRGGTILITGKRGTGKGILRQEIHKQAGLLFEYLFLLHISAVGYHVARGHGVLARMGIGKV